MNPLTLISDSEIADQFTDFVFNLADNSIFSKTDGKSFQNIPTKRIWNWLWSYLRLYNKGYQGDSDVGDIVMLVT